MNRRNGLSLDPDLEHRIEALACAMKSIPSDVVRMAFEEFETKHNGLRGEAGTAESAYDAFNRAGAIGSVKGGPPDLSTNLKYMEGFGRD
jgi:hypothetical protein